MAYPLATIWSEYEAIRLREGSRIAAESILMQTMLGAAFSGKPDSYNKALEKISDGR